MFYTELGLVHCYVTFFILRSRIPVTYTSLAQFARIEVLERNLSLAPMPYQINPHIRSSLSPAECMIMT